MRQLCCGLVLVSLLGCVQTREGVAISTEVEESTEFTEIHMQPAADEHWRVVISFPRPIDNYVFRRTPVEPIRERWRVETQGVELTREGHRDVLRMRVPLNEVVLSVPADDRFIRADYSLTQTFDEGNGVVLYSGHFIGGPAEECAAVPNPQPPCAGQMPTRFHWVPVENGWVWFDGQRKSSTIEWLPSTLRGGFAYFGDVVPIEQGNWRMLIDPLVPIWMREDLADKLPKISALYEQWYGQALRIEPQLLFSMKLYEGADRQPIQGLHTQGGVIDNMVRFTFKGSAWLEDTPQLRRRYSDLVAHEVAHLWNGGMYGHEHSLGANWLHEGNADSMARRVSAALGMLNESDLWAERSASLNRCSEIIGLPLNEAAKRHRFDLYYDCGEIIDLAVEGVLRDLNKDPHAHWRHMFAQTEREYSMQSYLESVGAVTRDFELVEQIRQFALEGFDHPDEIVQLVTTRGVALVPLEERAADTGLRAIIQHLHKQDCQGGFSFSGRDRSYVLHGLERCSQTPAAGLHLTSIAGEPPTGSFLSIYRQVNSACATGKVVVLDGLSDDDPVRMEVLCQAPFRFVQLGGWQGAMSIK